MYFFASPPPPPPLFESVNQVEVVMTRIVERGDAGGRSSLNHAALSSFSWGNIGEVTVGKVWVRFGVVITAGSEGSMRKMCQRQRMC